MFLEIGKMVKDRDQFSVKHAVKKVNKLGIKIEFEYQISNIKYFVAVIMHALNRCMNRQNMLRISPLPYSNSVLAPFNFH